MTVRGIRGATTAAVNSEPAILEAAGELLLALQDANGFNPADLAAIWFTTTRDLNAAFPAKAARQLGWVEVPLLDAQEMDVPGSLTACIRVLIFWNTELGQSSIKHLYLRGARVLRPDLAHASQAEEVK